MLIEEKQIPYRIVKLPLNAYGYKPEWYTRRVDGGKLPAVELDGGELILESLTIMRKLDDLFPSNGNGRMAPLAGSTAVRAETLMQLEAAQTMSEKQSRKRKRRSTIVILIKGKIIDRKIIALIA